MRTTEAVAERPATDQLHRGALGVPNIVFLVLAAAAPLGAMAGPMVLVVGLGNGAGAPGTYAYAALALAGFAVGYAAMSRYVTNAGAFYAYISQGVGRVAGVAAAYVAVVAYNAVACGVLATLGAFAAPVIKEQLGIDLPWEVWAAVAFALVAFLAYRRVELSARVLGVALLLETLVLLVMDVAIVFSTGVSFSLDVFSPATVFAGAPGVAFLFAFNSFIGFEATAIFGEEAKDPHRTIPRATYAALGIIGVFYAFTAWCVVSWFGAAEAQSIAAEHVDTFVFDASAGAVGSFPTDVMQVLLVTSLFASLLGIHNSAARYHFALARERLLPRRLAHTHPRFGSPVAGSALGLVLIAVPVIGVALAGSDPYLALGAIALALGTIGLLLLQSVTSFSVIAFFLRKREEPLRLGVMVVGPAIGGVALAIALYLGIDNWALLTGVTSGWQTHLPWAVALAAAVGVGVALARRSSDPRGYRRIGHAAEDDE